MNGRYGYGVLFTLEEGGYVVSCRDIPEVVTQGRTLAEALDEASDPMDEAFAARLEDGLEFPKPSKLEEGERVVYPAAETAAKAALYMTMHEQRITKSDLARRMRIDEKEVRRMLDPHHGSRVDRIGEALRLLGKELAVGTRST